MNTPNQPQPQIEQRPERNVVIVAEPHIVAREVFAQTLPRVNELSGYSFVSAADSSQVYAALEHYKGRTKVALVAGGMLHGNPELLTEIVRRSPETRRVVMSLYDEFQSLVQSGMAHAFVSKDARGLAERLVAQITAQ